MIKPIVQISTYRSNPPILEDEEFIFSYVKMYFTIFETHRKKIPKIWNSLMMDASNVI